MPEYHIGRIHSVETFGLVDGPGVRYVLFLQGCNFRCQFCHNPETWNTAVGLEMTSEEAFKKAYRYQNYWKNNGGLTVSGGEPLLQIDFLTELFTLAKEKGVHTTLDTSGGPFTMENPFFEKFQKLMEVTDLVMLDIKEMDPDKHRKLTGHSNENVIQMAEYLNAIHKDTWIRHVLVPNLTDGEKELKDLRSLIDRLDNVSKVEILPYHTLGTFKWEKLQIDYPLEGVPVPTAEEVARAEEILGITK